MADATAISYGALLLGGFLAFSLSGVIFLQCILYFKVYSGDTYRIKIMVLGVWFLDLLHSAFVCASLFDYFVTFFGDSARIDHIPWSIALTVVVTALQTFLTQCYFAQKILKSSKNNWLITGPIVLLALFRLTAACVSTVEMIRLHRYSVFTERYPGWVFTTGLSLSAGVDIIITAWLCYFLREIRSRIGSTVMVQVVDTLTIYTLENGALTCIGAIASLICWLTMPTNLIFLGLHFVISKLYANSLLASLNTRNTLRQMRMSRKPQWSAQSMPGVLSTDFTSTSTRSYELPSNPLDAYRPVYRARKLEVIVEQDVEQEAERDLENIALTRMPPRRSRHRDPVALHWTLPH